MSEEMITPKFSVRLCKCVQFIYEEGNTVQKTDFKLNLFPVKRKIGMESDKYA